MVPQTAVNPTSAGSVEAPTSRALVERMGEFEVADARRGAAGKIVDTTVPGAAAASLLPSIAIGVKLPAPSDLSCGAGLGAGAALAPPSVCAVMEPAGMNWSEFDPGNIIPDGIFYDTAALSDVQIRAFIDAQGVGCADEFCLKNLQVNTQDQPADQFCSAYEGGVNEDTAAVLGKVSRACGVNPQVMLVTLQKESGLLSRADPTASTYDAAWGWHCPDTGPGGSANCDPAYAGFFNQAYGMAKQWSRYRVDPDNYNYRAGQTVNIQWNVVESGCGSAPVTITNTATASLYNYTPYQPNAAALASYPGTGDACSAYGNRNFFFLFGKYFGGRTGAGGGATLLGASVPTTTEVTIPKNRFVDPALAGRVITAPTASVAAGLAAGFAAVGLPYVWGGGGSGAGPNNGCSRGGGALNSCGSEIGFDCSGLTAFVLGRAGFRIPGDSSGQRAIGTRISWDLALPGDVVGFPGHVAVYLGSVKRCPVHPGGIDSRHACAHREIDAQRYRPAGLPVLGRHPAGRRRRQHLHSGQPVEQRQWRRIGSDVRLDNSPVLPARTPSRSLGTGRRRAADSGRDDERGPPAHRSHAGAEPVVGPVATTGGSHRLGVSDGNVVEHRNNHRCTDHRCTDHRCTDHRCTDHRCTDHGCTDHGCTDHGCNNHRCTDHRHPDADQCGIDDYGRPGDYTAGYHPGLDRDTRCVNTFGRCNRHIVSGGGPCRHVVDCRRAGDNLAGADRASRCLMSGDLAGADNRVDPDSADHSAPRVESLELFSSGRGAHPVHVGGRHCD